MRFPNQISDVMLRIGRTFRFDARYVAENAFWLNSRYIFNTIGTFVLVVVMANALSPDEYGRYKFIIAAVTFWGGFLLTGINSAVTGAVARGHEGTFLASIPLQFKWDLFGAFGILCTGGYYVWNGDPGLGIPIIIGAVLYPFSSVMNTYIALLSGRREFRRQSLFESLTTFIYVAVLLIGVLCGASPSMLAIAFFASNAAGYAIGFLRSYQTVDRSASVEESSLSFAKKLSLVSIPSGLMLQLDSVLVFHYLGSADLAVYTFAMLGPDKIGHFLKFLPTIALPKYAQRTAGALRSSVVRRAVQFGVFTAAIAVAYAAAAPFLFKLVFPQYMAAVRYTQWYALSLLTAGAFLTHTSLLAQQSIRRIAALQFVVPACQVAITFAGITLFGLAGAIGAKLVGDVLTFAATAFVHQYERPAVVA